MKNILNRLKIRDSSGDTLVEVLVVLAVLSLAFAISYATAHDGLVKVRNAEEHSQALGNLNSQVELVRKAVIGGAVLTSATPFCMNGLTAVPTTDPACRVSYYNLSIIYNSAESTYQIRANWAGTGNLGPQQERITYRIRPLVP